MQTGRFGTLIGFSVSAFGAGLAWRYPDEKGWALFLIVVGAVVFFIALVSGAYTHRSRTYEWIKQMGTPQIVLIVAFVGVWVSITAAVLAGGWLIWNGRGFTIGQSAIAADDTDYGPLTWVHNLSMEGGGAINVFSVRFRGANTSKEPVRLEEARIVSLIDGTAIALEVIAFDPGTDKNRMVPIDKVQLIPPGAPIELAAKFGPPDPNVPGNILGIEAKAFLETWRQFTFTARDDKKSYRMDFNENIMSAFFQGRVGPRVIVKPDASAH